MADATISRKDARAQGLTYYFTGLPCPAGHIVERYVSTYGCIECARIAREAWKAGGQQPRSTPTAPSARSIAREKGLDRYFTGVPCKRGHVSERYVKKGVCIMCDGARRLTAEGAKKKKDQDRRYGARHAEKARKRAKEWAVANPERVRENRKAWRKANPDKVRVIRLMSNHRRRALERSAAGTFTAADLAQIFEAQGFCCAYCKTSLKKTKRHLDHIVPLFRGGSCDRSNLQFLCAPCNLSKGHKDPSEFARTRGLLL